MNNMNALLNEMAAIQIQKEEPVNFEALSLFRKDRLEVLLKNLRKALSIAQHERDVVDGRISVLLKVQAGTFEPEPDASGTRPRTSSPPHKSRSQSRSPRNTLLRLKRSR